MSTEKTREEELAEIKEKVQAAVDAIVGGFTIVQEVMPIITPTVEKIMAEEQVTPLFGKVMAKLVIGGFEQATLQIEKSDIVKSGARMAFSAYQALIEAGFTKSEALRIICARAAGRA